MMDIKEAPMKAKDYKSVVPPTWCPGCGDYGVLNAVLKSFADGILDVLYQPTRIGSRLAYKNDASGRNSPFFCDKSAAVVAAVPLWLIKSSAPKVAISKYLNGIVFAISMLYFS